MRRGGFNFGWEIIIRRMIDCNRWIHGFRAVERLIRTRVLFVKKINLTYISQIIILYYMIPWEQRDPDYQRLCNSVQFIRLLDICVPTILYNMCIQLVVWIIIIIMIILHAIYRYIHLKFFRIYDPITNMGGTYRWPCLYTCSILYTYVYAHPVR